MPLNEAVLLILDLMLQLTQYHSLEMSRTEKDQRLDLVRRKHPTIIGCQDHHLR